MTSAVVKSVIVGAAGLVLAVYFGSLLGNGEWVTPVILASIAVLAAIYTIFFKALRLEALILGFLLFGYIVGNRGFAQISVTRQAPIYLGEAGMLACLAIVGARVALKRERLAARSALSGAIVVFLLIGAARLATDLSLDVNNAPAMTVIRDSATIYYALFFFVGYSVGSDAVGRRLVERCVLAGCVALLPVLIIQLFVSPELFTQITFRGYPVIYHKGDLTSAYLAFASFFFFLQPARGLARIFFRLLAVVFFLGILLVTSRAAIFGYSVGALLVILARRSQLVIWQLTAAVVALIIVGVAQFGQLDKQNTTLQRVADKIESMTDLSGGRSYRGEVGDYSSANNQFRMVWWQSVFDETMRKGPIFGLGFGYDLAAGFIKNYYSNLYVNFEARSPHSIWLTILGRMGLIGLLSFSVVVFLILREAFITARKVARGALPASCLAFLIGAIIILGSASFGVVLEGPMGGILFWSFLGLAVSQSSTLAAKKVPAATPEPELESRQVVLAG